MKEFGCLPHEYAQLHPVQREWLEVHGWAVWEERRENQNDL